MKFNLSKKQKLLSLIILAFVLIIGLIFFSIKNSNQKKISKQNNNSNSIIIKPVFLDNAEKASLNISPKNKIQVIKRNAQGKVGLYKVINNDRDIITDLNQITPTILPVKK